MQNAKRLLRISLAFPLLYASIGSLTSPKDWLWYIPDWLAKIAPAEQMLLGHGVFELLLGVWLLSGKKTQYAAIVAGLDLTSNTLLNITTFNIVFRDVGLIFASIALVFLEMTLSSNDSSHKK